MSKHFLLAVTFIAMILQARDVMSSSAPLASSLYRAAATESEFAPRTVSINWAALADATLNSAVADGEIPGATIIIVDRNETLFAAGYGVANLENGATVSDATLFEVGSVGKTLTAIAALQQVEQGRLDLSANVNDYLDDWHVETPGAEVVTLHHLLTHSAGLNDRAIGYAAREESDVQALATHLEERFPPGFAIPGQYISYSNYGFGLAGYLVEKVSGTPFTEYVAIEILEPLGIVDSGYRPNIDGTVATGYLVQNDNLVPAPYVYRPVTPAGSFIASARDMAPLMQALLNNGSPVLDDASAAMMMMNRQSQHTRLMGNAYGLEETRRGNLTAFGKGGSIPGFTAYMTVIPRLGLGMFIAVNASTDAAIDRFIVEAFDHLSTELPPLLPPIAVDISRFTGEYRSNRYDRTSLEKLLRMEVHHVYPSGSGALAVWHDGDTNTYRAIDSLVFQNVVDTNRFLVFEENEHGNVTHAFFNDRIAGGYVPVVWEKNGFWNSNEYVNEYFGIVLLVALSYLLFPLVIIIRAARRNTANSKQRNDRRLVNFAGLATSALLFAYVWFYFIPLMRARPDLIFGIPANLASLEILSWFVIAGFGAFSVLWLLDVSRGRKSLFGQIFGFLYLLSGALVCEFFLRWNLL